jgi:glycosyltransferase involved in cell wall biosynthesis
LVKQKFATIDLIHQNILYPSGIMALYLSKIMSIPFIITEHWTGYLPSKKEKFTVFQKFVSKKIAGGAACITPVSANLRDAMMNCGLNGKYEVIYNVADTKVFYPSFEKKKRDKIKFIHISTLDDPHKNISGMLRVAEQLSKNRNDFEIWFVGDGDIKPHVETAKQLKIHNKYAFFDGTKTSDEVAELMRSSDCFLLFSNYENLPCVMIEALASGLPIVASSVGGIPEHITKKLGVLVPPKEELALQGILNKIIDDIKFHKYNPEVLSSYAKDNFSYESVGKKFVALYNRILA